MGEALKTAGPVAARTGQTLEQVAAQLGVLANMGIRGSMAGTALARSYKQLADPKIQKMLEDNFGIHVTENGNMRDMATVFAEIGKAISAMPNAAQVSILEDIFNARGSLGGGTLSINAEGIEAFLEKLKEATGYAKKASGDMQSGLKGAMDGVSSAFEGVRIAIGTALEGPLKSLLAWVAKVANSFKNWINDNKGLVIAVGTFAGILATLGTALAAVSSAIGIYTTLQYACSVVNNTAIAPILAKSAALKEETVAILAQNMAQSKAIWAAREETARNAILATSNVLVAKTKTIGTAIDLGLYQGHGRIRACRHQKLYSCCKRDAGDQGENNRHSHCKRPLSCQHQGSGRNRACSCQKLYSCCKRDAGGKGENNRGGHHKDIDLGQHQGCWCIRP